MHFKPGGMYPQPSYSGHTLPGLLNKYSCAQGYLSPSPTSPCYLLPRILHAKNKNMIFSLSKFSIISPNQFYLYKFQKFFLGVMHQSLFATKLSYLQSYMITQQKLNAPSLKKIMYFASSDLTFLNCSFVCTQPLM